MKIRAFFLTAILLPISYVHASTDLAAIQKSAEQGDAEAQGLLGIKYSLGDGVPQDDQQAAAWYRKAAEQGDAIAQSLLGATYESGRGLPQDYGLAVAWYRKAAEQGNAKAQCRLGIMYSFGRGVPQSYSLAYSWLSVATALGNSNCAKGRDMLAEQLTPSQLAAAQEKAANYFEQYQPRD